MSVAEMKAALPISSVTVYPRSALIQRRGDLRLSGGETRIGLSGLPGALTQDSVRIEVEPEQGLLILDVTVDERLRDPSDDADYRARKDEYDALLREKARTTARLSNTLSELSLFLDKESLAERPLTGSLQGQGPEAMERPPRLPGGHLPVNLQGWKEFFSFLRERLADNRSMYREHLFELLELEKKIGAASANLSRLQGARDREHWISVRVEAPREGHYALSLLYLQEGVFWYPVYAVAGDPREKSCTLSLSAVVGQSTGEDWRNVELLLSTAVPRFSCSIPELSSKRLREAAAEMEYRAAAFFAAPAAPMKTMADEADEAAATGEEVAKAIPQDRARYRQVKKDKAPPSRKMRDAASARYAGPSPATVAASAAPARQAEMMPAEPAGSATAAGRGETLRSVVEEFDAELAVSAEAFRSDPYADALFRIGCSPLALPPEPPGAEDGALPSWMDGFVSPLESLGGYDYRYPVTGRRDVASSPVPRKVPVDRKVVQADFTYLTIPAVREAVFLKARFANEGDNPLPTGPAQIFAGDTLIGSLSFPTLGPGEKGEISLGVERDIKVLRRQTSVRRRRGVVSKDVITDFTVEIELVSHKDAPLTVVVFDRLPVSRQPKEIAVQDFRAEPAARLSERKVLSWSVSLEPRKKTLVGFRYSIRHPADFRVALEEDPVPFQMGKEE
jgi:hypothetical protein